MADLIIPLVPGHNFQDGESLTASKLNALVDQGSARLSGPMPVGSGGTGSTSASGARSVLGAAGSGDNSDITTLTGLTEMPIAPVKRTTVDNDVVLDGSEGYVSVDASSNDVNVTLNPTPVDGEVANIKVVDATNMVAVIGTVDGVVNPGMLLYESLTLVYNSDITEWEIR